MAEPIPCGNRFSGWPVRGFIRSFRRIQLTHSNCKRMGEYAALKCHMKLMN